MICYKYFIDTTCNTAPLQYTPILIIQCSTLLTPPLSAFRPTITVSSILTVYRLFYNLLIMLQKLNDLMSGGMGRHGYLTFWDTHSLNKIPWIGPGSLECYSEQPSCALFQAFVSMLFSPLMLLTRILCAAEPHSDPVPRLFWFML